MKTNINKINNLKLIIDEVLAPEITNDYIYLDLPYYTNIGDTLIWEGTKEFLRSLPYKCLYASDMNYFVEQSISSNTIILLQGGGNFGDLYREHTNFRKKIIQLYPQNKVIILPQSVYYENEQNLLNDIIFYSKYKNVLICTREQFSYQFIKSKFLHNRVLLMPDLAFYINITKFQISSSLSSTTLFLKRQDSELVLDGKYHVIPDNSEIYDWPTFTNVSPKIKIIDVIFRCLKLIALIGGIKWKNKLEDIKRDSFYRKEYVQIGVDFLSKYDVIYTTRLHALILAVLLDKRVFIYDNLTGKLINFYNTWLLEFYNINVIEK